TYTIKDGDGDLSHTTLTISVGDSTPSDSIPAPGGATTTVYEAGLPPHGGLPAGSGEIADGNPNNNSNTSETTSGTIGFTSPDGVQTVSLGGHVLTGVPQTFTDATGSMTASYAYNAATGVGSISYAYTLTTNTSGDNTSTSFAVVVTDADGDSAPAGNLTINIVDDVPTAHADTDSVAANQFTPEAGNVLTAVGTTSPVTGVDVLGADGATVAGVAAGTTNANLDSAATVGTVIHGTYGDLTLGANGDYSYTRNAGSPGGVNDVFTYTIKDGDGDLSHTTLTISVGDSTPTISNLTPQGNGGDTTVNEKGLPASSGSEGSGELAAPGADGDPSEHNTGTFTITSPDGIATLTINGTAISAAALTNSASVPVNVTTPDGNILTITGFNAGTGQVSYTYTLLDNETHPAAGADSIFDNMTVTVTDTDGDVSLPGTLSVQIIDDVPTLGTVQSQQASTDTSQAPAVGTLHFVAGADGVGATMTITANTTGITSAGHNLITEQSGNVLTAYADNNNNGTHDAGDTAVFTITVNPSAGTSGQYTFDLLAALDGTVSNVSITSNGAYGSGPSNSILVAAGGQNVVMVTGWAPTDAGGSFTPAHEAAWLAGGMPSLTQTNNVNGSNAGWGLGNNNFNTGEFMRFDFGTPNDYDGGGPYTPPAITIANVSYAKFSFDAVSASNKVEFVAHYTDGSTAHFVPVTGATTLTINSPAGLQLAWIDAYESAGATKLNLTDLGVSSTTVDHTIPVTLQLTDGDGDTTGTANFTVHVAAGLTPFVLATPVVLDLNHDGIHTTDLTHSTISYDYNSDGLASKTAWVDQHDGILAIDLNGDGKVSNASEFVFTQQAPGAATDLAALEQLYDTNHDGKLTAADHDFAKFGVWQDANGNGVADSGEFKSLAALGIVEIGLESNHQQSVSADGSVVTFGEATFTTADGQSGAVGDIGFGNYDGVATGATSTITGTSGADTFKIDNLNIKDLIADYHGAEGDKIDLTALFDKAAAGNIADYVHYNSATSTVSVDTSGSGNAANFVDVAVLQNAPAAGTINILYDDATHTQQHVTI
ncbi:type I secretion C-terminal target domain-containing protein, partial [Mesorhizobium sp. B2-3-15]|uniref:beta strand repeat-containing protein n=1 Tax=Mesorhizobium sp. B2-3-15 TaxID=2589949 RepID=UPI0011261E2C